MRFVKKQISQKLLNEQRFKFAKKKDGIKKVPIIYYLIIC